MSIIGTTIRLFVASCYPDIPPFELYRSIAACVAIHYSTRMTLTNRNQETPYLLLFTE